MNRCRVVKSKLVGGRVGLPVSDTDLAKQVDDGEIVILRGAYDAAEFLGLRTAILDWSRSVPEYPKGISASRPFLNFHRRDEDANGGYLPHKFHVFGFGDCNALPPAFAENLRRFADPLLELENRLSGNSMDLSSGHMKIAAARHPRGGGYASRHVHPYLPRKVMALASLSTPGKDHSEPSLRLTAGGGEIAPDFRAGDILVWRYDLPHEFLPVDPAVECDWDADDGCWIFGMEMVEAHQKSELAPNRRANA